VVAYLEHLFTSKEYAQQLSQALAGLGQRSFSPELGAMKDIIRQYLSPSISAPSLKKHHAHVVAKVAASFRRLRIDARVASEALVETMRQHRQMALDVGFIVHLSFAGRPFEAGQRDL
jgi:hypothetical protein